MPRNAASPPYVDQSDNPQPRNPYHRNMTISHIEYQHLSPMQILDPLQRLASHLQVGLGLGLGLELELGF